MSTAELMTRAKMTCNTCTCTYNRAKKIRAHVLCGGPAVMDQWVPGSVHDELYWRWEPCHSLLYTSSLCHELQYTYAVTWHISDIRWHHLHVRTMTSVQNIDYLHSVKVDHHSSTGSTGDVLHLIRLQGHLKMTQTDKANYTSLAPHGQWRGSDFWFQLKHKQAVSSQALPPSMLYFRIRLNMRKSLDCTCVLNI